MFSYDTIDGTTKSPTGGTGTRIDAASATASSNAKPNPIILSASYDSNTTKGETCNKEPQTNAEKSVKSRRVSPAAEKSALVNQPVTDKEKVIEQGIEVTASRGDRGPGSSWEVASSSKTTSPEKANSHEVVSDHSRVLEMNSQASSSLPLTPMANLIG